MPHTSRKKQQHGPGKQVQVTDDCGWTHVFKITNKQKQSSAMGHRVSETEPIVEEAPKGTTLEKVHKSFDKAMIIWKESECYARVQAILRDDVMTADIPAINNCVCLGLGDLTFAGARYYEFYQLAAMHTILEILGEKHKIENVYMQDPTFNTLDKEFLRSRGYHITIHPEGIEKVNKNTFLFAPHLDWPVYAEALKKGHPSLFVGNDIQEYIDTPFPNNHCIGLAEPAEVLEAFLRGYSYQPFPDFDRDDCFTSTSIFWRRPIEDDDEGSVEENWLKDRV